MAVPTILQAMSNVNALSSHYLLYLNPLVFALEFVVFVLVILLLVHFFCICGNCLISVGEHDMRKVVPTIWQVLSMHQNLLISQHPAWPTTAG